MIFQITSHLALYGIFLTISVSAAFISIERDDTDDSVCNTDICKEAASLLLESINSTVNPCENFFDYTCSGWIEKHPIPPSEGTYDALQLLVREIMKQAKDVLTNPPVKPTTSTAVIKVQNLYKGCIDSESRQKQGVQPVKDLLQEFGGWPILNPEAWDSSNYKWPDVVAGAIRKLSLDPLLKLTVGADDKNADQFKIYFDQPMFSPGRNQMINMTAENKTIPIITAYKEYIVTTSKLLGANSTDDVITQNVENIINFESELAKFSRSDNDRKDVNSLYNNMTIADMQQTIKGSVDWKAFLNTVLRGFSPVDDSTIVVVKEVDYLKQMLQLTSGTNIKTLANFIGWKIVETMGRHSTTEMRDAQFQFQKVKYGTKEPNELYQTCDVDVIDLLGFAAGRVFVDKYFSDSAKKEVDTMVDFLKTTYNETLTNIGWMDDETKNHAVEKVNAFISMMGYPEWIKDDTKLDEYYENVPTLNQDAYYSSFVEATSAKAAKSLQKWNEKRDKTQWFTAPPIPNAFYDQHTNSITFPAGILNAPTYKHGRPPSMNYGGIGAIIGHEMSHGFDDTGGKYDKNGNLLNWWKNDTKNSFNDKAKCFRDQYSSYVEPITGLHLNGNITLGENIADNGAVRNAYKAYSKYMQQSGKIPQRLPGLDATPEQLFFLSYAYMFCGVQRKEYLEMSIQYSPHTPGKYRIIIPLTNSEDFSRAFNCSEGTPMNPKEKCVLW